MCVFFLHKSTSMKISTCLSSCLILIVLYTFSSIDCDGSSNNSNTEKISVAGAWFKVSNIKEGSQQFFEGLKNQSQKIFNDVAGKIIKTKSKKEKDVKPPVPQEDLTINSSQNDSPKQIKTGMTTKLWLILGGGIVGIVVIFICGIYFFSMRRARRLRRENGDEGQSNSRNRREQSVTSEGSVHQNRLLPAVERRLRENNTIQQNDDDNSSVFGDDILCDENQTIGRPPRYSELESAETSKHDSLPPPRYEDLGLST